MKTRLECGNTTPARSLKKKEPKLCGKKDRFGFEIPGCWKEPSQEQLQQWRNWELSKLNRAYDAFVYIDGENLLLRGDLENKCSELTINQPDKFYEIIASFALRLTDHFSKEVKKMVHEQPTPMDSDRICCMVYCKRGVGDGQIKRLHDCDTGSLISVGAPKENESDDLLMLSSAIARHLSLGEHFRKRVWVISFDEYDWAYGACGFCYHKLHRIPPWKNSESNLQRLLTPMTKQQSVEDAMRFKPWTKEEETAFLNSKVSMALDDRCQVINKVGGTNISLTFITPASLLTTLIMTILA